MTSQLAWLEYMERVERECFPDARPRSEVMVPTAEYLRSHEPPRNSGEGDAVNGPTPLAGGDESHT